MVLPIRIAVGRTTIRAGDYSPKGVHGRSLASAMKEVASNYGWFVSKLEGYLAQDLYEALKPTYAKTQVLVPKDTGNLADSGYLETERKKGEIRVEMGYGRGGDPDYAIYVHEIPATHKAPTRDKFVQVPLEEDHYKIIQRVTDIVRARVGGR